MGERCRGGERTGFTSFWPLSTFASVRVLIIAFNRDKEQLLMMLLLILTCSCPSAAALPCRSPANWESCSAYCSLPADEGGTTTMAPGLRRGMRSTGSRAPEAKGGEVGYIVRRAGLTGAPHPCLGTAGLSIPRGNCPFSAFGLQQSLAEGWPSRGQSQAAGRHLSVSPLFCTGFCPPRQIKQKLRVLYRKDRLQNCRSTQR